MAKDSLRRRFLLGVATAGAATGVARAAGPIATTSIYNVAEFGARRNGRDPDTQAIQNAIDACAGSGGGTVYFPTGEYYSGGVILRSRVHLYLDAGVTIHGSPHLEDYPVTHPRIRSYTDNYTERSLIYGEDLVDTGLHGDGVINGHGAAFEGPYMVRPYLIRLVSCRDVSISGVTLRDSPMWVQHYLACDDVTIHGITVHSRVNRNNDGIDIDGCHRVTISDCNVSSGDDAIVLKSTLDRSTKNVAITNCVLSSHCNAFKLGTESNGGFEDIVLSNCTMYDTRLSGIAIEMVDGGLLSGVSILNVTMRDVRNPIFVRLGDRARPFIESGPKPGAGTLRDVRISGVKATGAGDIGCPISGIPGHPIENLSIDDVSIAAEGGVKDPPLDVPEHPDRYPEHNMFGQTPAHGLFCRHVRNLRLRNVQTETRSPDERPAFVAQDVGELEIVGCAPRVGRTAVWLHEVRGGLITGCRLRGPTPVFLNVERGGVNEVSLIGNDLSRAETPVFGPAGGIFVVANRRS